MARMTTLLKTGVAAVVLSTPAAALAHRWGFPTSGLYVGAGAGAARNQGLSSSLPAPFVNLKRSHLAWKAFAGFAFNRFFAIQAGYQNFGTDSISTPVGTEQVRNRGYDVNGLLSFPFTRQFSLFVEGGASRFQTHTITPVSNTTSHDGTHPDYGAGVQFFVAPHVAVRGQWQEFRIPNNNTQLYSGSLVLGF